MRTRDESWLQSRQASACLLDTVLLLCSVLLTVLQPCQCIINQCQHRCHAVQDELARCQLELTAVKADNARWVADAAACCLQRTGTPTVRPL